MTAATLEVGAICREVVSRGVAPNAAAGFARRTAGAWRFVSGGEAGALFDLASVTKSVFAVAFARSRVDRGSALAESLDVARGTSSEDTPLELLFAHRAGLAAHLPLYEPLVRGERVDLASALRAAADSRDRLTTLPAAPLYSDLGYLLAGKATGDPDALMLEHVIGPLRLERELGSAWSLGRSGVDVRALAPPTEVVPWRGGELRGRVHDENAWALGGDRACGHAGLFGDVDAVLRFGAAALDALEGRASPLAGELEWLVRERPGGTLRAGFDGKSPSGSSAGAVLGPRSFGHLGFTGTSLWIDPDAGVCVALLTNRVHPTRDNALIREARPWAHDRLARAALR